MTPRWMPVLCLTLVLACDRSVTTAPQAASNAAPADTGSAAMGAPAVPSPGPAPALSRQLFQGVVERLVEHASGVDVSFSPYAAVYHLPASHPAHRAYLDLLRRSLATGRSVHFGYTVGNNEITIVKEEP